MTNWQALFLGACILVSSTQPDASIFRTVGAMFLIATPFYLCLEAAVRAVYDKKDE
jgi:hypothetical protein